MPNFVLTKSSILICLLGGMATQLPPNFADELTKGELRMLLNEMNFIARRQFIPADWTK